MPTGPSCVRRAPRAPLLLALAALAAACGGEGGPRRPHLFFVTADTLRADHTTLFGYARDTTPNLAAFAERAIHFSQAVTLVPKTGPSFASHLTGLVPADHGVTTNLGVLPDGRALLAEILREHGYATAAFVSNPVLAPRKGFARGFDHYAAFEREGGLDPLHEAFLAWSAAHDWDQPTFVWIHYIDPHGPYTPPARYRDLFVGDALFEADRRMVPIEYEPPDRGSHNRVLGAVPIYQRLGREQRAAFYVSQYDAEIRYMDDVFGALLRHLDGRGLLDGAGLVFTSDHGESLGEHDYFFEHGWYVYDASLRVPLVVKPPGGAAAGRVDRQVSNLDTLPTFLTMAGLPVPPGLPGRSLLAPGEGAAVLARNPSTYPERFVALRTPERKLVVELGSGRRSLYDLVADPGEREDRAAREPELTARLHDALEARLREAPETPAVEIEPTPEELERLRELGYAEP